MTLAVTGLETVRILLFVALYFGVGTLFINALCWFVVRLASEEKIEENPLKRGDLSVLVFIWPLVLVLTIGVVCTSAVEWVKKRD